MMPDLTELWFVSFADSRLSGCLRRLRKQVARLGIQEKNILLLDETGLDSDFRVRMKGRLRFGTRGFGYWCWKPQCVLQAFRKMPMGGVLIYADVGCHVDARGKVRLPVYLDFVARQGMCVFQLGQIESEWTKGDLLDYFDVRENRAVAGSGQICATAFLVMKTPATIMLFERYAEIMNDHEGLIDDSASVSPNAADFKEHRHDQSVFSILCKTAGLQALSVEEITPREDDMTRLILARRDVGIGWRGYVPLRCKRLCFAVRDRLFSLAHIHILQSNKKWWSS